MVALAAATENCMACSTKGFADSLQCNTTTINDTTTKLEFQQQFNKTTRVSATIQQNKSASPRESFNNDEELASQKSIAASISSGTACMQPPGRAEGKPL
jgi:DNA-binding transcriptional regulator YhcF (GntR family)